MNSLLWICCSISGVAALMLELLWMRSAGLVLGMGETTVIELVPEVAAAARSHFRIWNARLLERSDVRLVLDDGRRYLAVTPERCDVIVSDLFIPWHAGTGNLYAREMYNLVARRLAPGGIFANGYRSIS